MGPLHEERRIRNLVLSPLAKKRLEQIRGADMAQYRPGHECSRRSTLRPACDAVLARMKARGLTYLELAYPEGAPDPLPGELLEAAIPTELK